MLPFISRCNNKLKINHNLYLHTAYKEMKMTPQTFPSFRSSHYGLAFSLLPALFPPEVLYSSFSGLNQKVLLSSTVFWCLAPKSSFHRKFCSLGSPASLWAPYSVFSGQHTSSSRYCILLPASSCGAQNHHSTSLQGHLRARRTCRIPRPGSHAVAEHTDCPSHPSPPSRLLS